jgi:hypothetical protein
VRGFSVGKADASKQALTYGLEINLRIIFILVGVSFFVVKI